jgi:predicted nucleic acid-binding Zn ribbon protein
MSLKETRRCPCCGGELRHVLFVPGVQLEGYRCDDCAEMFDIWDFEDSFSFDEVDDVVEGN